MKMFAAESARPWMVRLIVFYVLTVVLAACSGAAVETQIPPEATVDNVVTPTAAETVSAENAPLDTVKVGVFGLSSDAAVFIAIERGYFAEQGIEVETSQFSALSDMIPALATGQLDVGNANVGAALFNALTPTFGLKIVADNATIALNNDGSALVIRPELVDQIKEPTDLIGLNIGAVADKGTPAHVCMEKYFLPAGFSVADITMVQLPFPAMGAALANGAVDGAMIVEPFLSTGLNEGLFVIYKGAGEMCPGDEVNVQVYSADFAAKTDLAQRFAIARLKGARDFNDAFFGNTGREAVVEILVKHTALKDPALYEQVRLTLMNPDGAVNNESLKSYLDWYVEYGFVEQEIDLDSAIDGSFASHAVEVLGAYE